MIRNPFYATDIHPTLFGERPAIISEDEWVEANLRLIEEEGPERWLRGLLATLKTPALGGD